MAKKRSSSVKFRHLAVFAIFKGLTAVWLRLVYRFRAVKYGRLPSPCFIVSNHLTDCDMIMLPQSFTGLSFMYFVSGEHAFRAGFASRLLEYFFDPIPRFKGTTAASTVLEMMRRVRAGASVALFPEGCRSFSGETGAVLPATGSLAKKLGVPLVTYRIEGGYLTAPRWSNEIRRGKMTGRVVGVYSAEELRQMTDGEVLKLIKRDIYENAFDRQKSQPSMIRYRSRATAKNIERAAVVCPNCSSVGTVYSDGNFVKCSCGLYAELDEYGFFSGDLPFETMAEWLRWQNDAIAALPDHETETVLCRDPGLTISSIDRNHKKTKVADGDLVLTTERLAVGEKSILIRDVISIDTYKHGYLLFTTRDSDYYEIRGENDYEGYKYYLLIKRYQKSRRTP